MDQITRLVAMLDSTFILRAKAEATCGTESGIWCEIGRVFTEKQEKMQRDY